MEWLRTHPYTSALCAAAILVLVGAYIVQSRAARPVETQASAWGGGVAPLLNPTSYGPTQNPSQPDDTIAQQVKNGPPYTYIPPRIATSAPTATGDPYDFESFVAFLAKGSVSATQTNTTASGTSMSAYTFIPRGLISTSTSNTKMTATQQALYNYGNDIGSTIESFEQQHSNTVQILKGQVEDRADPDKAAAVAGLGHAFEDLGRTLLAMDAEPSGTNSAHAPLAQSHIEIGKNLALVPYAERDSDFIAAIQIYNTSADTFTKNYIRMVSLFAAYGVSFTSSDSGRVFTFSPSGF